MTYEQLASAIKNNVSDGLKSPNQFSYSIEQLIDEALLLRARIIYEKSTTYKVNSKYFTQKISKISLSCEKLNGPCSVPIDDIEMSFKIPKPADTAKDDAISFIGPIDNSASFKIYYDDMYRFHSYRSRTAHKPFVFVDLAFEDDDGRVYAYLMNASKYKEIKYLTIRGVFANPKLASVFPNFYEDEFAAPYDVQSHIIDQMTQKYISYYRQLNMPPQPNTQSSMLT